MSGFPARRDIPLIFFLCGAAGFVWTVSQDPFFWDTIQLASKHAHFFYENGHQWEVLPPEIDSGHPPVFGYYLAGLWTFFGKTLAVGHWGMLPFLFAIVVFLYRLGRRLGGDAWAYWILPVVLLDPVLLGQSALVSPDVVLATFFLCSLDGILNGRRLLTVLGIAGLCMISMRGMMCAGALFLGMFLYARKSLLRGAGFVFLPGFALAAAFLVWHWRETGWIGYHAGSPWAPAFRPADWLEMCRNIGILGWRWLDFGRFGEWMALAVLFWLGGKRGSGAAKFPVERPLTVLLLCVFLLLSISAVRYNNLSAHRYFLPVFLLFHLFVFQWIVKTPLLRTASRKWTLAILSVVLALGNFQVYPHGISMDWDSTPAHLPYHEIRKAGIEYLQQRQIPLAEVGSAFPNINSDEVISLNGDRNAFVAMDTARNRYIFISNVFNDVSRADRAALRKSWQLVWQEERGAVWGEIYKKK